MKMNIRSQVYSKRKVKASLEGAGGKARSQIPIKKRSRSFSERSREKTSGQSSTQKEK